MFVSLVVFKINPKAAEDELSIRPWCSAGYWSKTSKSVWLGVEVVCNLP